MAYPDRPPDPAGLTGPVALALLPVIAGLVWVGVPSHAPPPIAWAAGGGAALALAAVALTCRLRWAAMSALTGALFCAGGGLGTAETQAFTTARADLAPLADAIRRGDTIRLEGRTVSQPEPTPHGEALQAMLTVDTVWLAGAPQPLNGTILLRVYTPDPAGVTWRRGDHIRALVRLSAPRGLRNEGYRSPIYYYWLRRIVLLGACKSPLMMETLSPGAPTPTDRLRSALAAASAAHTPPDSAERAILDALLLGRPPTDPAIRNGFVDAGLYHLLVVSGLHVGLLTLALAALARLAGLPQVPRTLLLLGLLAVYVHLLDYRLPPLRAALMVAAYLIGALFWRRCPPLNAIALAALVLLAWRPWSLHDTGFQLTFLAVTALAVLLPPLEEATLGPFRLGAANLYNPRVQLADDPLSRRTRRWRFRLERWRAFHLRRLSPPRYARLCRWGAGLAVGLFGGVLAGLAVQTAIAPSLVAAGLPLAPAGLILSVPATLLTWGLLLVLLASGVSLAVAPTLPGVDTPWRLAVEGAHWLHRLTETDLAAPVWLTPSTLALGLLLGGLALAVRRRATHPVRWLLAGLTLALVTAMAVPRLRPPNAQAVFLDVGAGDCLLFTDGGGRHTLIDTGGLSTPAVWRGQGGGRGDLSRRVVIPTLAKLGVTHLDALVLSHLDFDHAGSAPGLLLAFPVRRLYLPEAEGRRAPPLGRQIAEAARQTGVPVTWLAAGDQLVVGNLRLDVLHPPAGPGSPSGNRNSLVLSASLAGLDLLLPGDADIEVERELGRSGRLRPTMVLKSPHHGSRTSSSRDFLTRLAPAVTVISAGDPNRTGHPAPDVLQRMAALDRAWVTTHQLGQITVYPAGPGFRLAAPVADRPRPWRDPFLTD